MNQALADMIRHRRKGLGMTQRDLAERIRVSDKAISKWERGTGLPDGSLVPELSRILGVSAAALLGRAIAPNPP